MNSNATRHPRLKRAVWLFSVLILLLSLGYRIIHLWQINRLALTTLRASMLKDSGLPGASSLDRQASEVSGTPRLLGVQYLMTGNTSKAIPALAGASSADKLAAFWLGQAYWSQNNREAAIATWRRAGAAPYFLGHGQVAYERQDFTEACERFLLALAIAPDQARSHMYAGHCYYRQGNFALAEAEYRRAIEVDPTDGWSYVHLSNLLSPMEGRLAEAQTILADCIERAAPVWREPCQVAADQLEANN